MMKDDAPRWEITIAFEGTESEADEAWDRIDHVFCKGVGAEEAHVCGMSTWISSMKPLDA